MAAFEALFRRHQPALFRTVVFQVRDTDAAHDIVQETFKRVWERRASLRPALSFPGLLHRISLNLVRDAYRHALTRERAEPHVPPPIVPEDADPLDAAAYAELATEVRRVMREELPARCGTVFAMSRLEGMSNEEIASALAISPKTVEHQLGKALRIMRRALAPFLSRDSGR